MEDLLPFLQKYSDIDTNFIKEFIEIQKGDNVHYPFSIDLDIVAKWLKTEKGKIKKTLIKSYKENIDYILLAPRGKQKIKGSGGHNKKTLLLTSDTFKMLTMKSKTKEAQKVRYYYVTLEKLVSIYKDDIIKYQNDKIEKLERNLKKIKYPVKGALYIINISDDKDGYKIGKTKNLNERIPNYKTAHKDDPEITDIFYTDDIHRLEKCVKIALKEYEYRNNKEYYLATREQILDALKDCQHIITKYKNKKMSRSESNKKNKINFKLKIEYINDQKGGSELFVIYKLNKEKYIGLINMF